MEVSLIEGEDRVALAYGPEVSEKVEAELAANGVGVYTGEKVDEFTGEGRVRGVKFGNTRARDGPRHRRRRDKAERRAGRGSGVRDRGPREPSWWIGT